jgi:hypothetical protein
VAWRPGDRNYETIRTEYGLIHRHGRPRDHSFLRGATEIVEETVKLVLERMCSGELAADTGIDIDDAVGHLCDLAKRTVRATKRQARP